MWSAARSDRRAFFRSRWDYLVFLAESAPAGYWNTCHANCVSACRTATRKNPGRRIAAMRWRTTKRSKACHRLIAEPSAFCTRMHQTCIPSVCPDQVQNLAKKPNSQQEHCRQQWIAIQCAGFGEGARFVFADDRHLNHLVDAAGDDQQRGTQQEVVERQRQGDNQGQRQGNRPEE